MKQGWEIAEFEKCLEKVTYTNKIQRKDFKEDGIYPIVSQEKDFVNGYWDNEEDLFKVDKPVVLFGDHTQVLKFIDFDFVLGADGVKIIKPKDKIDSKYFYYFLQNADIGGLGYARHYRLLKKIIVTYPKSLTEQQRIVAVLDEAFAAIDQAKANTERNLKNAKELFDSYLQGVFEKRGAGWEEITLADVCDLNHGFAFEGTDFEIDFNGSKPIVLTPGNFTEDCRLSFTPKNTKRLKSNFSRDYLFDIGELVVVMTDLSPLMKILGKPAIIDREGILHNQRIGRFVFKENTIEKRYLFYFLQTNKYLNSVRESATGTMVRHTAPKRILRLTIPIPKSKESQQTIICQLDDLKAEIQKLEAVYHKKLLDLDELKKSILQKAFTGELTTT